MDALLLLFLFSVCMVLIFGGMGIGFYMNKKKKEANRNAECELIRKFADNEILTIKQALTKLNISIPTDSSNNLETLQNCANELCLFGKEKIRNHFKEYSFRGFSSSELPFILYNDTDVLLPSELFRMLNTGQATIHATESGITYFKDLTVNNLIEKIKELKNLKCVKSQVISYKWDEMNWYLDGIPSRCRIASVGSGAVAGGLLFGVVGALAGAVSSNKEEQEIEKKILSRCVLKFGPINGAKRVIAKNWYSSTFQSNFSFLMETCPNIRSANITYEK